MQVGGSDERFEKAVYTWLGERQTLERVEQQAKITHGARGLGTAFVCMGFAAPLPETDAEVAACVAHRNDPGLHMGEIARFLDFTLSHQRPHVVSMEGLALLTGINLKKLSSLSARCAPALHMLGNARLSRVEAVLLNTVPREGLIHYIKSAQHDETELSVCTAGNPVHTS